MTTAVADTLTIVIGPRGHGVVEHALTVAGAMGVRTRHLPGPVAAGPFDAGAPVHHLHYTDALFGSSAEAAAAAFARLAERLSGALAVTLHDVPHGDDARQRRRAAAYRAVARMADVVIIASAHEAARARRSGIGGWLEVIPLPVVDRPVGRPVVGRSGPRSVGVLGYVYPGKGHAEVLAAAGGLPPHVAVIAGGRASDGHGDLVTELTATAAAAGRRFASTGWLDEPALERFLATTTVPVVAAPAASASASLNTWIGAGRRPLVVANDYTAEVAARAPELLELVTAEMLGPAMVAAVAEPERTWRSAPVPPELSVAAVAAQHAHVLSTLRTQRRVC